MPCTAITTISTRLVLIENDGGQNKAVIVRDVQALKKYREQKADDLPEALRAMVATQGIFAIAISLPSSSMRQ